MYEKLVIDTDVTLKQPAVHSDETVRGLTYNHLCYSKKSVRDFQEDFQDFQDFFKISEISEIFLEMVKFSKIFPRFQRFLRIF